jgi:hypothetical protein
MPNNENTYDVLRLSMVINRNSHPELVHWIESLPKRKTSQIIRDILEAAVKSSGEVTSDLRIKSVIDKAVSEIISIQKNQGMGLGSERASYSHGAESLTPHYENSPISAGFNEPEQNPQSDNGLNGQYGGINSRKVADNASQIISSLNDMFPRKG